MRLLLITLFFFSLAPIASADVMYLKNGDTLTGEVVKHRDEYIYFKTSYSNLIRIEWTSVKRLQTTKEVTVLLKNGSFTKAKEVDEKGIPSKGILAKDEVRAVKPKLSVFGSWVKSEGQIGAGLDFEDGNGRDKREIDLDGVGFFRTEHNRLMWKGELEKEKRYDQVSKDNWTIFGQFDTFLQEKVFLGVLSSFTEDEFSALQSRKIYSSIVGYQFYERPRLQFWVQGGPARIFEEYDQKGTADYWATGLGAVFNYRLVDNGLLFFNRWYAALSNEDSDKQLLDIVTGVTLPLIGGLSLTADIGVEYDSQPDIDADESEPDYGLKLGYVW